MVVRTRRHHVPRAEPFRSTPASCEPASKSLPINSARSSTRTTHSCTHNFRTEAGWRQWIPPVVRCTPALIIRKFTSRHYTVDDLIARGTLTRALADFLAEQISQRQDAAYQRRNGDRQDHTIADTGRLNSRTGSHRCHRGHPRTSDPEAEHVADGMPDQYVQDQVSFDDLLKYRSPLATRPHHSRGSARNRGTNVARFLQHGPCGIAGYDPRQLGGEGPLPFRQSRHAQPRADARSPIPKPRSQKPSISSSMLSVSQAAALSARSLRFAAMTATRNASLLSPSSRYNLPHHWYGLRRLLLPTC